MKKWIKKIKSFFAKNKKEIVTDLPQEDLTQYMTTGEPVVKVLDRDEDIEAGKRKNRDKYNKDLNDIAEHGGTSRASPDVLRRLADYT